MEGIGRRAPSRVCRSAATALARQLQQPSTPAHLLVGRAEAHGRVQPLLAHVLKGHPQVVPEAVGWGAAGRGDRRALGARHADGRPLSRRAGGIGWARAAATGATPAPPAHPFLVNVMVRSMRLSTTPTQSPAGER